MNNYLQVKLVLVDNSVLIVEYKRWLDSKQYCHSYFIIIDFDKLFSNKNE